MKSQCATFHGEPLAAGVWGQGPDQKEKTL